MKRLLPLRGKARDKITDLICRVAQSCDSSSRPSREFFKTSRDNLYFIFTTAHIDQLSFPLQIKFTVF